MAEQPESSPSIGAAQMRFTPGYDLHPIRLHAAVATSACWHDAFVTDIDGNVVTLADFKTGEETRVWHHIDLTHEVAIGAPASLHTTYDVLSLGDGLYISVLPQR